MAELVDVAWGTLPRSGTFYQHFVLEYWNALLEGRDQIARWPGIHTYPSLGLRRYQSHADAPGLADALADPAANGIKRWRDSLVVPDYGLQRFPVRGEAGRSLSPMADLAARVVYFHRNPLDHAVSMYHHTRANESWRREEAAASADDIDGFALRLALPKFTRQYLGYEALRRARPDAVLMVAYEDMMRRPADVFRRIMAFLGRDRPGDRRWLAALDQALEHASPQSVQRLEQSLPEGSLLGTPDQAARSHIQSGGIGRWRDELAPQTLKTAANLLGRAGIDLESGFKLT